MNTNKNNKFQLIDDYLQGGMNQDELDSFKAFMQSDKDLALDTAITAELMEASAFSSVEAQLKATLEGIRRERSGNSSVEPKSIKNYWKIIAVAALLGLISYVLLSFFNPFNSNNQDNGFQKFAMVEPLELGTKSMDNAPNLVDMESFYNEGKYLLALPEIEKYLKTNPKDLDVLIAKGIALTEIKSYREAHQVFTKIAAYNPRVKKHLWFDAIAYAKEGKTLQAVTILNTILKEKSYNHEYARAFLAQIN